MVDENFSVPVEDVTIPLPPFKQQSCQRIEPMEKFSNHPLYLVSIRIRGDFKFHYITGNF